MAGHSKWANIKHRKGRQDAKKGKIFTRIGKEITIAARDNGGDPDSNSRLRLALKVARLNSMPNENIARAIKRGIGESGVDRFEEITFEGYAPDGVIAVTFHAFFFEICVYGHNLPRKDIPGSLKFVSRNNPLWDWGNVCVRLISLRLKHLP